MCQIYGLPSAMYYWNTSLEFLVKLYLFRLIYNGSWQDDIEIVIHCVQLSIRIQKPIITTWDWSKEWGLQFKPAMFSCLTLGGKIFHVFFSDGSSTPFYVPESAFLHPAQCTTPLIRQDN